MEEELIQRCGSCGWDRFTEVIIADGVRLMKGEEVRGTPREYADYDAIDFVYRCSRCGKNLTGG
jgi:hypothetical protein